jgi:hypothetical protein
MVQRETASLGKPQKERDGSVPQAYPTIYCPQNSCSGRTGDVNFKAAY